MKDTSLLKFLKDQLSVWPLAAANFRALKQAQQREMEVDGLRVKVQHNPLRIISTTADIDPDTIAARPCFLCEEHRPKEQFHLKFEGRKGKKYNIQVNPYPIFPRHFVIARDRHIPQSIWHCLVDFLDLSRKYPDYTIFYNGPLSGASAPDHMHFQMAPRGLMPLEAEVDRLLDDPSEEDLTYISAVQDAKLYHYRHFTRGVFALKARTAKSLAKLFYRLLDCAPLVEGDPEPRFNLFTWSRPGELRVLVTFRARFRSHHYDSTGEDHLTMSFGCADMAGFFVAPHEEDFRKLTPELLSSVLAEVSLSAEQEAEMIWKLTRTQPKIEVGIMSGREIVFEIISDGAGPQKVSYEDGKISYGGVLYDELYFDAVTMSTLFAEPSFILHDVTIGVDFHWQRRQDQKFAGALKFILGDGCITAVNIIGLEDYLLSVISSEMRASASLEFLCAHAIISRSWVLTNLRTHAGYDVCADDHCQRYQGLTLAVGERVRQAIDRTWGQVLTYDGQICDARYSKCCGGRTELFSTCWEDRDYPYLQSVPDTPAEGGDPFCHTDDETILTQVLNDYDLETRDFFEWTVRYRRDELSELVRRRTGIDFGTVRDLHPLQRGPSGRICRLEIVGDRHTEVIGKELAIRRALSGSHLKSSAFDIVWEGDTLVLHGHGWGHGVGLCQIGAAVMAARGYTYQEILAHYYPGTKTERR